MPGLDCFLNLRQRAEPEEGPACRVRGKKRVRVCPHYIQARKASRHLNLLYLNGRDLRRLALRRPINSESSRLPAAPGSFFEQPKSINAHGTE